MSKERIVIGVDPGLSGAAVALDLHGFPVASIAADHPSEGYVVKKKGGGLYVPSCIALFLVELTSSYDVVLIIIEQQQARPIEGRSSILKTGYGWGLWVGIVAALRQPYRLVSATAWTRAVFGAGRRADRKARSIATAAARVPSLPLTWGRKTKPHDGLSDAACLALYGLDQIVKGNP